MFLKKLVRVFEFGKKVKGKFKAKRKKNSTINMEK